MTEVAIRRLAHGQGLALPAYESEHVARMDLRAAEDAILPPGGRALVATGFAIALPDGFEAQVRPRSGLAAKHGFHLAVHRITEATLEAHRHQRCQPVGQ